MVNTQRRECRNLDQESQWSDSFRALSAGSEFQGFGLDTRIGIGYKGLDWMQGFVLDGEVKGHTRFEHDYDFGTIFGHGQ
jgi:hypothetical protein